MNMTWETLVVLEPKLQELLEQIKNIRETSNFCSSEYWYNKGLKNKLCELVGWDIPATSPDSLRSGEAYVIAYSKLYNALPPCKGCLHM